MHENWIYLAICLLVICMVLFQMNREGFFVNKGTAVDESAARVPGLGQVHSVTYRPSMKMSTLRMSPWSMNEVPPIDYNSFNPDVQNTVNYDPRIGYLSDNVILDNYIRNQEGQGLPPLVHRMTPDGNWRDPRGDIDRLVHGQTIQGYYIPEPGQGIGEWSGRFEKYQENFKKDCPKGDKCTCPPEKEHFRQIPCDEVSSMIYAGNGHSVTDLGNGMCFINPLMG